MTAAERLRREIFVPGPSVCGLDLSLTSTGMASEGGLRRLQPGKRRGHMRLEWLLDQIRETLGLFEPKLVVVEGPSYGSTGSSYHQLAGMWWIVVHHMWREQVPYAVVSPQQRAKYATGKGNAGKDAVLAAAVRRFPGEPVDGNDVADALILRAMGCDHLGAPLARMPETHRAALAAVTWPEESTP